MDLYLASRLAKGHIVDFNPPSQFNMTYGLEILKS